MTDQEVICTWMAGAKPNTEPPDALERDLFGAPLTVAGGWWECHCVYEEGDVPRWYPRDLTLDALHEVEGRLKDEQWGKYERRFNNKRVINKRCERCGADQLSHHRASSRALLHATPEQKIKALAAVLRPIVEGHPTKNEL
jgi:hypothetical protein